jgi:hypothetical protein
MDTQRTRDDETFSEALALIDTKGTLKTGSPEYATICGLIRGWIDECGREYSLRMAQDCGKHFDRWRKFI